MRKITGTGFYAGFGRRNAAPTSLRSLWRYTAAVVICFALLIAAAAGLSACGSRGGTIAEYYPFLADTMLSYEGEGHILATYNVYNTIIRDSRAQKIFIPTTDEYQGMTTEVLEYKDGELRFINGDPYYYHFDDMTHLDAARNILILKEPLRQGQSWEREPGITSEITSLEADITVPAGVYKTLEVTTTDSHTGQITVDNYAAGIGLVKTTYSVGEQTITSSLSAITSDFAVPIVYNYFFPDHETGEIHISQNTIEVRTNYNTVDVVNEVLQTPHPLDVYSPLVRREVFTGASIDYSNFTGTLNFTGILGEVEFGGYDEEKTFIHCLALTAGGLLALDYAAVYVDGEPYAGEFFTQNPNELFTVNINRLINELQEQAQETSGDTDGGGAAQ